MVKYGEKYNGTGGKMGLPLESRGNVHSEGGARPGGDRLRSSRRHTRTLLIQGGKDRVGSPGGGRERRAAAL